MGSEKYYQEEAPSHRVSVDGFWIDRTPVTNKQFRKFVNETGYVTVAETPTDPKDYPCALPHMLKGGVVGLHTAETSGRSALLVAMVEIQIRCRLAKAVSAQLDQRSR
jgi:formylglycine-generating enzyme required for sulfatase activity